MGCVYKIEFPSGKVYIGMTMDNLARRIKGHVYAATVRGSKHLVHKAIRKYCDNYTVTVIAESNSKIDLQQKEIACIEQFRCLAPLGYNSTKGGESVQGYKWTEEQLRRNPMKFSESRARLSAAKKGIPRPDMLGSGNPMANPDTVEKAASKQRGIPREYARGARNPMKDPAIVAKMVATRKLRKETNSGT